MLEKEGFHKTLRAFIAENHYSQKEAAAALHVSRTTLTNWLSGAMPNGQKLLDAIAIMSASISLANTGAMLQIDDEDWKDLTIKDKRELKEDIHRRACFNRSLRNQ